MNGLSERLMHIADMVEAGGVLVDVGCDHGYLPILLVKNKRMQRAIAMDINEGPLCRAREHIAAYGVGDYIETRLSNGLEKVAPGEADAVIIAGMGGGLTIDILTRGRAVVQQLKQLILEPQSELSMVRKYLREQDYLIEKEDFVLEDGKYYPILRVLPGQPSDAETFAEENDLPLELVDAYGQSLLEQRHPVLISFLEREYAQCEKIRDGLPKKNEDNERIRLKKQELSEIMGRNWAAMMYMGQILR